MGYNPIAQINESIDFDPASGKIQRQNVLINIRHDSPEEAYRQYMELRDLILNGTGEKKINDSGEENVKETPPNTMMCDDCGKEMILRSGSRGFFWGCSGYSTTGCRNTKPAIENEPGANSNKMETSVQEENSPVPICPRHKIKMWLHTKRSDGQLFFGCALYDSKGCLEIIPYPAEKKANVKIPAVTY